KWGFVDTQCFTSRMVFLTPTLIPLRNENSRSRAVEVNQESRPYYIASAFVHPYTARVPSTGGHHSHQGYIRHGYTDSTASPCCSVTDHILQYVMIRNGLTSIILTQF